MHNPGAMRCGKVKVCLKFDEIYPRHSGFARFARAPE
jgi:hypothetical protein